MNAVGGANVDALPGTGAILAQAPCRVDLAGSTLDIWPLYLFHPAAVTINFAVNILTTCRIAPQRGRRIHLRALENGLEESFEDLEALCRAPRYRLPLAACLVRHFAPPAGFTLETHSESPPGGGISASSALMVATAAALARYSGVRLPRERLRLLAQDVEAQVIRVPTGCQDYFPALYGGASAIRLTAGGVQREAIPVPAEELDERFALVHTGTPHQSGINNWQVFKAHIEGDRRVRRNFERIAAIAREMHRALALTDWREVARLLREEWKLRKSNAPGITTPNIERLVGVAARNGAVAAKVCGAGGGGCVLLLVEKGGRRRVEEALRRAGGLVLPARVAREGLTVTVLRDRRK